jgi:Bacterial Ig-like domain (group 2)/Electron transfer DM13
MKKIIVALCLVANFVACTKKGVDVPPPPEVVVNVPERLEITPTSSSILTGQTAQFTVKYFNNRGVEAPVPTSTIWSSDNTLVASVNQQGLALGVAIGNANIKATYNAIVASVGITVVVNNTVLSTVNIIPAEAQEIVLNGTTNLMAEGRNIAGGLITGLNFTWASNAAMVQVNSTGVVTGMNYGSANITATANNITSAPRVVDVIRRGNFTGQNSMGTAKLKIENGILKLQTTANFQVSSAPDLRIYLTNSTTSIANAIQIAPLSSAGQTSGMRSWNVPTNINITQYRYALVWCAQFGGNYGVADFGL